jgi:CheY-like chemotaxis protein
MNLWVIDDDSIYQMLIKRMVLKLNPDIAVSEFLNGKKAFDRLETVLESDLSKTPDMIFLDINMPVMNGWEFLEAYLKIKSTKNLDIPVFIVSSSIDKFDFEKAKSYASVIDYLVKPISKETLAKYLNPPQS